MTAQLTIHEDQPSLEASSLAELDAIIAKAAHEAERLQTPNIIFIKAQNGNEVSLVVGKDETVLGFTFGHLDPPYYASKGKAETTEPVFTAFVSLTHHTEFPRRSVIPWFQGVRAVHEFVETGDIPKAIEWEEV